MRVVIGSVLFSLVVAAGPAQAGMWVDSRESADFSEFQTYAWGEGTPAKRPEVQQEIQDLVGRELDWKGLREVEEGADVLVLTHVLVDKHTLEQLADSGYWEFWTGVRSADAYDLRAGTLVVDLVDARTNDLVWRGVAGMTVSGPVDKNLKKIGKIIRKLFKGFPPD